MSRSCVRSFFSSPVGLPLCVFWYEATGIWLVNLLLVLPSPARLPCSVYHVVYISSFPFRGGHWGLRYCCTGQFFLRSFDNFYLEMRYCGILRTCRMRSSILDSIKNYPSSPQTFSEPFPVSDWTFPMKLISHGNGKLQYLVSLS